ncbi:hypothetical protein [Stutzerimonas marianensis]
MTREAMRRQLARDGWRQVLLMIVPALVVGRLGTFDERFGLLIFVAGLLSLFPSLVGFRAYKHGLIHLEKVIGSDAEPEGWKSLRRLRLRALMLASLPAWIAALGSLFGLDEVPRTLLVAGSLALLVLYRVPRQLA